MFKKEVNREKPGRSNTNQTPATRRGIVGLGDRETGEEGGQVSANPPNSGSNGREGGPRSLVKVAARNQTEPGPPEGYRKAHKEGKKGSKNV